MKEMMSKIFSVVIMLTFGGSAIAHNLPTNGSTGPSNTSDEEKSLAANCTPPVNATVLEFNSVRALIQTGGDMWWDFNAAKYEVPKDGGVHAIFAGSLWMGGLDVNGQLKLAAIRFRANGTDYWTGPLTEGTAEIDADKCREFDKHWVVTREMVEDFKDWYEMGIQDQLNGTTLQADFFPNYTVPQVIYDWPGNGDFLNGGAQYLAPFKDVDGDGFYDPNLGDYPWYDIDGENDCHGVGDRSVPLFGDYTLWWVFNDKGNTHNETNGSAIGMEVHAQAFSFATNDEVDLMTFYNYELTNRSTQTLTNTYFGIWVDADLGNHLDDYVGCDVGRGLGYCYNGDSFDDPSANSPGYGANPPAIGVDFFEGPYQDKDGIDNAYGILANEALNGIGYGDGVPDNERYGMRRFLYHNNSGGILGDPGTATDYYNYLRSYWRDNTKMVYGGNGHQSDPDADVNQEADFMFPGDSDQEFNWGTMGTPAAPWTEEKAGNDPADRRFMQSAGPFTLEPGDINNITVGVVFSRATSGGAFQSVRDMNTADDKAQALFDNCFKVLDGPDAPELAFQEIDRSLIVTISNPPSSLNYKENYRQVDPFIPDNEIIETQNYELDTATGKYTLEIIRDTNFFDNEYVFQGYQIYQLKDASVTPSDLNDNSLAREVFQCDIKDTIDQIVNYEFDSDIGASVPREMVKGANEGIRHSFMITDDLFAEGDRRLINHKTYYYMAMAYSYNNFKTYDQTDALHLDGQKKPYLASRKSSTGAIKTFSAIPHIPSPEAGGTVANSVYGDGPEITRLEGRGNGGISLDLTNASEDKIVKDYTFATPTYRGKAGPIDIKVIDPLGLVDHDFELKIVPDTATGKLDFGAWELTDLTDNGQIYYSEKSIAIGYEQIFPDLGFSINIYQHKYIQNGSKSFTAPLASGLIYTDSTKNWLDGIQDQDGAVPFNWIRSGTTTIEDDPGTPDDEAAYDDVVGADDNQEFESIIDGTWAPFRLTGSATHQPIGVDQAVLRGLQSNRLSKTNGIDVVITNDKSKWSRCVVFELQEEQVLSEGGATKKCQMRAGTSVDINGNPEVGTTGRGWFPGYAIDVETGERLNIAFGEDSWLKGENGGDMIWNPTSRVSGLGAYYFGGKHYIYVFRNDSRDDPALMPAYDQGNYMYNKLITKNNLDARDAWRSCIWVGAPLLREGTTFMSSDVKIKLRVGKTYEQFNTGTSMNNTNPMYEFSMKSLAPTLADRNTAAEALDLIGAVPNPYYAYSRYEGSRLDNRIKIVNLPDKCTVSIYSVNGTLIRRFDKDNSVTSIDWDLKNLSNVPIAGGTYIIHINAPNIGEKIIKWFGVMRPQDLKNL